MADRGQTSTVYSDNYHDVEVYDDGSVNVTFVADDGPVMVSRWCSSEEAIAIGQALVIAGAQARGYED